MVFFQNNISIYFGNLNPIPHEHHAIEIAIGVNAPLTLIINNDKTLIGKAFLILPNTKHQLIIDQILGQKIIINIDADLPFARQILYHLKKNENKFLVLGNSETMKFADLLISLLPNTQADKGLCLYSELNSFLVKLFPFINTTNPLEIDQRIIKVLEILNKNIHLQKIKFSHIAVEVGLSESRLIHLFKEEIGIPFRKYVLWTRLKTTVIYILQGKSISDASILAGFTDPSHFSKIYLKMFGLKPSEPLKKILS